MAKCQGLVRHCRNPECDEVFENTERYEKCPSCGADRTCGSATVSEGYKYCKQHGGPSPAHNYGGQGTTKMTTGKSSKSLVANLASKYLETQKNAVYISLKGPIDLLDIRILQLVKRIDKNEAPERVANLVNAWKEFKIANPHIHKLMDGAPAAKKAYNKMDAEVDAAHNDYLAWKQIFDALDMRRKLSVDEMKILKDMQAMLSAKDAYELAAQLLAACITVLNDVEHGPKYLKAIHNQFKRILGEANVEYAGGGDREIIDLDTSSMDRETFLHTRDISPPGVAGQD